jgi:hypothetical protein
MSLPPSDLPALATSTCVLAAMIVLGVSRGMLEQSWLRQCPSCGRYVRAGRRCACM